MYTLKCKLCGKEFENSYKDVKICPDCKFRPCEVCGKRFKQVWPYDQRACSAECRHILRTDKRFNSAKEAKKKANLLEKYGVDNVSKLPEVRKKISDNHKTQEFKDKIAATSLAKYGVDHPFKASEVQAKVGATMQARYGVDYSMQYKPLRDRVSEILRSPEVREKYKQTCLDHYGVYPPGLVEEIQAKKRATCLKKYGVPNYSLTAESKSRQAKCQISAANRALADLLRNTYSVDTEFEFLIRPKYYDLHVLNSNVVIEVNPSYTHSNLPNHWAQSGLPSDYHLNKSIIAEEAGYRCIHVFDWDDLDKVCSLIQPTTAIYARNCDVKQINPKVASQFLVKYHLQGKTNGVKFAYGLYLNDELISVMTFGSPRYNKNYEWELLRLCTKSGYSVIGGPSKLMSTFIRNNNPTSIISYCDRAKFTGHVYEALGFTLHHTSPPAKVWSFEDKYITDNLLRQRGFDQLFETNFGKGVSNEDLMIQTGWRSVYDCGQYVYEWHC